MREGLVCKICKSFYRLKQVGRLWNKIITKFFQKIGFTLTNADNCTLTIKRERKPIIVNIYIDKLVFGLKSVKVLKWLKDQLMNKFSIKD